MPADLTLAQRTGALFLLGAAGVAVAPLGSTGPQPVVSHAGMPHMRLASAAVPVTEPAGTALLNQKIDPLTRGVPAQAEQDSNTVICPHGWFLAAHATTLRCDRMTAQAPVPHQVSVRTPHLPAPRVSASVRAPDPDSSPAVPVSTGLTVHTTETLASAASASVAVMQGYAESLVGPDQAPCLDKLWEGESGWDPHARNPTTGAYGIPQAFPAAKMASAGTDWATNPETQIRWGVSYVNETYGSACGAEAFKLIHGWY